MGKEIRLNRILGDNNKKICIVPMDHGITQGVIRGLEDYEETIRKIVKAQADAVVLHKGTIEGISDKSMFTNCMCIMHLSASTNIGELSQRKVLVSSVEHAVTLGADAVSVHINIGGINESEMISDFGKISEDCHIWGMPLLAMMYLVKEKENLDKQIHLVRIAEELGADIVKMEYTDKIEEIVERSRLPILIAGGPFIDSETLLNTIDKIRHTKIKGISIGRNIFQSTNITKLTRVLVDLLNGKLLLPEAKEIINSNEQEVI